MLQERCGGAGCAAIHGPHGHAVSTAAQRGDGPKSAHEQTCACFGRTDRNVRSHVMRSNSIAAPPAHTTQRETLNPVCLWREGGSQAPSGVHTSRVHTCAHTVPGPRTASGAGGYRRPRMVEFTGFHSCLACVFYARSFIVGAIFQAPETYPWGAVCRFASPSPSGQRRDGRYDVGSHVHGSLMCSSTWELRNSDTDASSRSLGSKPPTFTLIRMCTTFPPPAAGPCVEDFVLRARPCLGPPQST